MHLVTLYAEIVKEGNATTSKRKVTTIRSVNQVREHFVLKIS